jgi:NADPH2:quinone reductase
VIVSLSGATPIDYRKQTVEQYLESCTQGEGFDLAVDTVGGATLDASFAAVKHFGHVLSALGWGTMPSRHCLFAKRRTRAYLRCTHC